MYLPVLAVTHRGLFSMILAMVGGLCVVCRRKLKSFCMHGRHAVAIFLAIHPMSARADQVIADDLIVVGNVCVGFDCSNGMSFTSAPLVLQENNTRLAFGGAGEFRLAANENILDGMNEFRIDSLQPTVTTSEITLRTASTTLNLPSAVVLPDGSLQVPIDGLLVSSFVDGLTDADIALTDGQTGIIPTGSWSNPVGTVYSIQAGATIENAVSGTAGFDGKVEGYHRYVAFSGAGNMVVLGAGSTYQSGAVSVGTATVQRSVKEVGDAVAADDLINLSQLQSAFGGQFTDLRAPIQTEFTRLENVSAMTAALSALHMNPRAHGPVSFAVGIGTYEGESAAALGLQLRATDRVHLQLGLAASEETSPQTSFSVKMHW